MSKEQKDQKKVPECLTNRYEILEKLVKDIASTSGNDGEVCSRDCIAKKVCDILKGCQGGASSSSRPQPNKGLPQQNRALPEQNRANTQMAAPMPMSGQAPYPPMPPKVLTQAAGCKCKPGSRNIEEVGKINRKKDVEMQNQMAKAEGMMGIDNYAKFGEAIAAELRKLNTQQADAMREKISRAISGIDEAEQRRNEEQYQGPMSLNAMQSGLLPPVYPGMYGGMYPMPPGMYPPGFPGMPPGAYPYGYPRQSFQQGGRYQVGGRRSTVNSEFEPPSIRRRRLSQPFYSSKSELFEYDRKREFDDKDNVVVESDSSISVDINDPGEELIDWQSHQNLQETGQTKSIVEEIKKEAENYKKRDEI